MPGVGRAVLSGHAEAARPGQCRVSGVLTLWDLLERPPRPQERTGFSNQRSVSEFQFSLHYPKYFLNCTGGSNDCSGPS